MLLTDMVVFMTMEDIKWNFQLYDILVFIAAQLTCSRLIFCIIGWLCYKFMIKPINYVKELHEVGWLENKKNRRGGVIGKIPPVYPNGWFAIAESDALKTDQVLHVSALGENFALFRSSSGKTRVLNAYCPHLGANMAVGGKVVGDCLQCPFHLWKFNGETGKCAPGPDDDKVLKTAKVKSWKTLETNGFIFIWYHAENEEPTWYPEEIDEISKNKFTFFGRNQFHINCHIQEVPENGSDMGHFKALHGAASMSGGDIRYHESGWYRFFRHKWKASWESGTEIGKRHLGISTIEHHITLFGTFNVAHTDIHAVQMGPGFVVLHVDTGMGPVILLQSVTPVEPLIQKVIHRVYSPAYLSIYTRLFFMAECYMFERDMMVWNNKTYFDQPMFTKEDKYISKFRRWYEQFYSQHSKSYSMAKETLDW